MTDHTWIAEARGSAERVALVLNAPHVLPEPGAEPAGAASLELAGVRHGPLDGLDLALRPGEFVGVVAYRPADAEALVAILAGRVAPAEVGGAVRLGGVPLPEVGSARAVLHVEPHHTDLFAGTLAANLAPGGADPDALAAALRASAADEVVAAHPAGVEHAVDERGAGLSGGQRQRLALARALLARPPILVLHDPTTAVDAVTEQSVALGVRALRKDLTTLVVTSSPALLAVADRVVVVDAGRVRAAGTHADLGATDADYAKAVLR
ncbi:ATP-binding cassette domain-containing protein [Dactylosporangium sp. McL0621]|uniref:ATP-binding cassette domain-containing protein n=1 Tax=Dactylosporangium sp. McL0621 TaxID=3415678 RepID=UPI003CF4986A